jgi:hypothetical protein
MPEFYYQQKTGAANSTDTEACLDQDVTIFWDIPTSVATR